MSLNAYKLIRAILVALLLVGSFGAAMATPLAGYPYHEIESWQHQGMVFVVRDADGKIVAHAKGHLEKWVSETQMVWVVRDSEGKFMTFARGIIETWKDGTKHLVLRNNQGKFVAIAKVLTHTALLDEAREEDLLHVLEVF